MKCLCNKVLAWFCLLTLWFVGPTPAATIHPAVVRVIVPEGGGSTSYGSGTLVAASEETGLVLTNWHVVCDRKGQVEVVFPSGFRSAARVIRTDRDWDLAALLIWRPDIEPVPIAKQAPQPGEKLFIAGYGSGKYRATTGECTQYLSPGGNKPFEMVELSTKARQGDSGGPILNQRGEMAGVLFGSAWGLTSGSHSLRVRNFLSSIDPQLADGRLAPQPNRLQPHYAKNVTPGPRVASQYQSQRPAKATRRTGHQNKPMVVVSGQKPSSKNSRNDHRRPWTGTPNRSPGERVAKAKPPAPQSQRGGQGLPEDSSETLELQGSGGQAVTGMMDGLQSVKATHDSTVTKDLTIWDHLKNVLCLIGGLAILSQVAKILSPDETKNKSKNKSK